MKRLIVFLLCVVIISCNPAKRAMKQDEHLQELKSKFDLQKKQLAAEAIAEYIKSNPCTQPELDVDSLCYQYYSSADSLWRDIVEKTKSNQKDFFSDGHPLLCRTT